MKQFDLEKYESVFFNLLEGNYSKQEEEAILEEIEANSFLKFEWDNWQKAVLEDDSEMYASENAAFFEALKDDADAVKVVPIWSGKSIGRLLPYMGLAAACLLIVFMFTINLKQDHQGEIELVEVDNQDVKAERVRPNNQLQSSENVKEELVVSPTSENEGTVVDKLESDQRLRINSPDPVKEGFATTTKAKGELKEDIVIDVDDSELEDFSSPENVLASASPTIPPKDKMVEEPVEVYNRKFTITQETVTKRDVVISQAELGNMNVRKLLENKRIKLVNIGNKTYVQLESPNHETVLVGLSE